MTTKAPIGAKENTSMLKLSPEHVSTSRTRFTCDRFEISGFCTGMQALNTEETALITLNISVDCK